MSILKMYDLPQAKRYKRNVEKNYLENLKKKVCVISDIDVGTRMNDSPLIKSIGVDT